MNLKEELLRGIYAYGFEKPSAIQQRAILPCIRGLDVIAQAQSGNKLIQTCNSILNLIYKYYVILYIFNNLGTGKTATFSISILQQIDTSIKECQALILAPTRELAQQVSDLTSICLNKKFY